MHPGIARPQTIFAALRRWLHVLYLARVAAPLSLEHMDEPPHRSSPQAGPSRSERRALRLQELGLLRRSLPAQDPIPVRESPEPLDYVPVPGGVGGYVGRTRLVRKPPEQLDGAALVLPVLAVHERHVQEHPL